MLENLIPIGQAFIKLTIMHLEEIKAEMKTFRDFYGGDLLDVSEIDSCTTKEELRQIIVKHESHMEMMLADALSHIEKFKKKVGLNFYQ